jgi:hypothetical protein
LPISGGKTDVGRASKSTWIWALGGSGVAAALSIAVNVATDLQNSVLAWVAVVASTVGSGVIAAAAQLRKVDGPPSSPRTVVPSRGRPSIGNYGDARDVIQAGSIGSVRTGSSSALVIAVGLVVVLAGATTIIAGAVAHRIGSGPAATNPTTPVDGSALRATVLRAGNLPGAPGLSFPATASDEAVATTAEDVRTNGFSLDVGTRAVAAGAYFYGGMKIDLELENIASSELTLFDVKPLTRPGPIADGTLLFGEAGGAGPFTIIRFNLDQPHPVAMEDREHPRPYFSVSRPGLRPHEKLSLLLFLHVYKTSEVFDVELDYEVDGKTYKQVLTNDGRHYRVSGRLCWKDSGGKALPSEQRPQAGLTFKSVYLQTFVMNYRREITRLDPRNYSQTCNRY